MSKIGILTYHYAHNYGAMLQAYALQRYLQQQGHDVSFVDYRMDSIFDVYKWLKPRRILRKNLIEAARELRRLPRRKKRYDAFERFLHNALNVDAEAMAHINDYDLVIVGSDQVWNLRLTGNTDSPYWGDLPGYSHKLVSYAASMEQTDLTPREREFVAKALARFDALSVREDSLRHLLQPLAQQSIATTVDPTLLINADYWANATAPCLINEPYVLLYQVRPSQKALEVAQAEADRRNCRLIVLSPNICSINSKECIGAGPAEFLSLVRYAEFVVSASFHGLLFSLIFQRPFYTMLLGDGKDARVKGLLGMLGLERFGVTSTANLPADTTYDREQIGNALRHNAAGSKQFIKSFLQ